MPPLRVRAPLDLDLEDHLIFGLTPVRFGYLAVGGLAAYALGAHLPGPFGLPVAAFLLALAAAFAWVRWRGRSLDAWLIDLAVHAHRNLEGEIDPVVLRRKRTPLRRGAARRLAPRTKASVRTIAVSGTEPGVGATTLAVELGTALALKGRRVSLRPAPGDGADSARLRLSPAGVHAESGLHVAAGEVAVDSECVILDLGSRLRAARADLSLVLVSGGGAPAQPPRPPVRAGHVEFIANRAGHEPWPGARWIPEDPAVPLAQDQKEPVILQFPTSRAAAAFRRIADDVDPSRTGPWLRDDSGVPPAG